MTLDSVINPRQSRKPKPLRFVFERAAVGGQIWTNHEALRSYISIIDSHSLKFVTIRFSQTPYENIHTQKKVCYDAESTTRVL